MISCQIHNDGLFTSLWRLKLLCRFCPLGHSEINQPASTGNLENSQLLWDRMIVPQKCPFPSSPSSVFAVPLSSENPLFVVLGLWFLMGSVFSKAFRRGCFCPVCMLSKELPLCFMFCVLGRSQPPWSGLPRATHCLMLMSPPWEEWVYR